MRIAALSLLVATLVAQPAAASWEVIHTDHLRVMYEPGAREVAERLAPRGEDTYIYLAGRLLTMPAPPWEIRIYATQPSFMAGTGAADWMAGVAVFREGRRMIGILARELTPVDPRHRAELEQILVHEMVHIALSGPRHGVPRWFDEGMAQYLAGQWSPGSADSYRSDILSGVWLSFSETDHLLSTPTAGIARIRSAYRQAHQAVAFLATRYGRDALFEIVKHLDDHPFVDSIVMATGSDLPALEAAFEDYIMDLMRGEAPSPGFWYGQMLFWLLLLLGRVIYLRIPRRRSLVNLP